MKIVIYCICKNEERFAKRFAESVKEADKVIVCDTGSNDKTLEILKNYKNIEIIDISKNEFRFDTARNISLSYIPKDTDVAISIDLDDIMCKGWRKKIEENWVIGETKMLNYPYVHAWEDGEQKIPKITIWGFKVHCPKSYYWKYPIHEVLELKEGLIPNEVIINDNIVEHHPDWSLGDRKKRIKIFEDYINKYIDDPRMVHLYARELYYHNDYEKALIWFKKYLEITKRYDDINSVPQTRALSCRLIAQCLLSLKQDINEVMVWFLRNVSESPGERESWMWLAFAWYKVGDGFSAYAAAKRGLCITNDLNSIEKEGQCWGEHAKSLLNKTRELMLSQLNEKN
jgi:glycosyltransferase involved in cell wall biosynthesis